MPQDVPTATTLAAEATQEFRTAAAAADAGDESTTARVQSFGRLVSAIGSASAKAVAEAKRLRADDLMHVVGKERLLSGLPSGLLASTADSLDQADVLLDVIDGAHIA